MSSFFMVPLQHLQGMKSYWISRFCNTIHKETEILEDQWWRHG